MFEKKPAQQKFENRKEKKHSEAIKINKKYNDALNEAASFKNKEIEREYRVEAGEYPDGYSDEVIIHADRTEKKFIKQYREANDKPENLLSKVKRVVKSLYPNSDFKKEERVVNRAKDIILEESQKY